jgi:hypothetical protein
VLFECQASPRSQLHICSHYRELLVLAFTKHADSPYDVVGTSGMIVLTRFEPTAFQIDILRVYDFSYYESTCSQILTTVTAKTDYR